MPELRINPDIVCRIIEAGRELAGRELPTTGDRTTNGDDSPLTTIELREDDPTRQLIVDTIADLNVEEQVDLLALIYLGRGDFDLDTWDDAVEEAQARIDAKDADFMIGNDALPAHLGDALDAFGLTCPD